MNLPKPPTGAGSLSAWCRQLLNYLDSERLKPGRDYNLLRSTKGVTLVFRAGGGSSAPGQTIDEYSFVSHGQIPIGQPNADQDYIYAVPVGSPDGTAPVKILKPYLLRFSIKTRNVPGQTLTYSNWDPNAQSRTASNLKGSVTQYITPIYAPGDLLLVSKVGKDLRDLNVDNRTFAAPPG